MNTWHIHIAGLVQGVGFRPFVARIAHERNLCGWVRNSPDGVHIEFNATENGACNFYGYICAYPPQGSIIAHHHMRQGEHRRYHSFCIIESDDLGTPDNLIAPDTAPCPQCIRELNDPANRRFRYPFITCTHCGPRYSIIKTLPFDRANTSMAHFEPCAACSGEYRDDKNTRYHSQTNSCGDCAIPMHLFDASGEAVANDPEDILGHVLQALAAGLIVAVKGVGGYLLLCDATNPTVIGTLRTRKQRPFKPFALLYADLESVLADADPLPFEIDALRSAVAPIVLCTTRRHPANKIAMAAIAPNMDRLGIMLPSSPLLHLIAHDFGRPLVATSANLSGTPVIFKDQDAREKMAGIADYLLSYDREIMTPEDDSVISFTRDGLRIILRRGRGLAPNYFPAPAIFDRLSGRATLAMGADLKSAFALSSRNNVFVSQYLGDQQNLEAQNALKETVFHSLYMQKTQPRRLLADAHPGFQVSQLAHTLSRLHSIPLVPIQHHEAHFAAVMAENDLPLTKPVLGIIWDGAGYGDDGHIWGGEIFSFSAGEMTRLSWLDYFPHLLGDKMNREPRLSALALLDGFPAARDRMMPHFSQREWNWYSSLLQQPHRLLTSSMGRLLDGIAAILGVTQINSFEGEAAMRLEALARTCDPAPTHSYHLSPTGGPLDWRPLLAGVLDDYDRDVDIAVIAWKIFHTLANVILRLSDHFDIPRLAFSGGVFQNTLLVELIRASAGKTKTLYFHCNLSPNDECIGFGQLARYALNKNYHHQKKYDNYVSGHTR